MKRILVLALAFAACSDAPGDGPVDPPADTVVFRPGGSYTGRGGYVQYLAGSLPIILSAPHGGSFIPSEIPDRTAAACGGTATTVTDTNTRELVLTMRDTLFARFGKYPHVIISHLHRRKLDPNREIGEAACGDAEAQIAWNEFQTFIDSAKQAVIRTTGRGWYMDLHGHGHAIARLELGYGLSGTTLDRPDSVLNSSTAYEDAASIRSLSRASPLTFAELLRGPTSLGARFVEAGIAAVPSSTAPGPGGADYFSGGYNTSRHACSTSAAFGAGAVCGVQVEMHFAGVRDNAANRARFASITATVLATYLKEHWGLDLTAP